MSTTFNYQILSYVEALYLGALAPSDLDKTGRFSLVFTSFINTSEKVFAPDIASEVVGDTISIKLDKSTLSMLLPILKPKTLYKLVLGHRSWSLNGRHGISYRLIDIQPLQTKDSLFQGYIGKLKDVAVDSSSDNSYVDSQLLVG